MTHKAVCILTGLALAMGIAGCRIHVDKDADGKRKRMSRNV